MEEDGEHREWGHTVGSGKEGWAGKGLHHGVAVPPHEGHAEEHTERGQEEGTGD